MKGIVLFICVLIRKKKERKNKNKNRATFLGDWKSFPKPH
jgi:hypothetical protein